MGGGARASSWLRRSRASVGWSWRGRRRPGTAAIERWPGWREELGIVRTELVLMRGGVGVAGEGEGSGVVQGKGPGDTFYRPGEAWRGEDGEGGPVVARAARARAGRRRAGRGMARGRV